MINKMNRTGQEFPGCPSQSGGSVNTWVPLLIPRGRTHLPETHGEGENMGHWKENSSFLPLKIGKSSKVGVFCSVLYIFLKLKTSKACYLLQVWKGIFKRIKTCKSILHKKLHQPVTRIGQFKGLYFSSGPPKYKSHACLL